MLLLEVFMGDRRITIQELSFVERWVRTGKAYDIACVLAILTSVAIFLVFGGRDISAVSVVYLIILSFSIPYNSRRAEKIRRGKEILNRYCPERNPRPLGL